MTMNKRGLKFLGRIVNKKLDKVRNKKSSYYGNFYLRLQVVLEEKREITEILVFKEWLANQSIWLDLEQRNYLDKKFLFYCQRKPGAGQVYRLIDWEELK